MICIAAFIYFINDESPGAILTRKRFGENKKKVKYYCFIFDIVETQISAAKVMMEKLKKR